MLTDPVPRDRVWRVETWYCLSPVTSPCPPVAGRVACSRCPLLSPCSCCTPPRPGWRRPQVPRRSAGPRRPRAWEWCAIWTGDVSWRGSAPERERAYSVTPVHYLSSVHINAATSSRTATNPLPGRAVSPQSTSRSPLAGICRRWPATSRHRSHNPPAGNTAPTHTGPESRGYPLACRVLPSCTNREPSTAWDIPSRESPLGGWAGHAGVDR